MIKYFYRDLFRVMITIVNAILYNPISNRWVDKNHNLFVIRVQLIEFKRAVREIRKKKKSCVQSSKPYWHLLRIADDFYYIKFKSTVRWIPSSETNGLQNRVGSRATLQKPTRRSRRKKNLFEPIPPLGKRTTTTTAFQTTGHLYHRFRFTSIAMVSFALTAVFRPDVVDQRLLNCRRIWRTDTHTHIHAGARANGNGNTQNTNCDDERLRVPIVYTVCVCFRPGRFHRKSHVDTHGRTS